MTDDKPKFRLIKSMSPEEYYDPLRRHKAREEAGEDGPMGGKVALALTIYLVVVWILIFELLG